MSELHKFIFNGLPVRGTLVRITDSWQEVLRRRAANTATGAWPQPVAELVGEMAAAGVLLQDSIVFDGPLVLQIFGDGPVKVAAAEVLSDLRFRATATVTGEVAPGALLSELVNAQGQGRCAITLDPGRAPGQQPYQSVVPLTDERGNKLESLAAVIGHYMRQSEQIDTALVLAADEHAACGLLIQRLPGQGEKNLARGQSAQEDEDEHFQRIAVLAQSLRREELLTLDADTLLHRLFWQERLTRFVPLTDERGPRFACACSREGMMTALRALGEDEVRDILRERGEFEISCDFCGHQEHFDAVDMARLFTPAEMLASGPDTMQ
ncbi:MAG: Hsp33 family molecular chaperone HslO [Burkholderiaceae bacterium]|jgi:molecular chaperone Hsp33|nr:Hsp33 family molecular chaperone HslO [Burkholderiaceae bacterium]